MVLHKNILLITIFNAMMCGGLIAGPTYAAKWVRGDGGQVVYLYQDIHGTLNNDDEHIKEFWARFCTLQNDCLLLIDDENTPPLTTESLYTSDGSVALHKFMKTISLLTRHHNAIYTFEDTPEWMSKKGKSFQVKVETISLKSELILLYLAFMHLIDVREIKITKPIDIRFCPIIEILQHLVTRISELSQKTCNPTIQSILDKIAETLTMRKNMFVRILLQELKFKNIREISYLSFAQCDAQMSIPIYGPEYDTKYTLIPAMINAIAHWYAPESSEAMALWHIAGKQNPYKRIILIANETSIQHMEKHLGNLGYIQDRSHVATSPQQENRKIIIQRFNELMYNAAMKNAQTTNPHLLYILKYPNERFFTELYNIITCPANDPQIDVEKLELKRQLVDPAQLPPLIPVSVFDWILE